jgi:hypothetical protein
MRKCLLAGLAAFVAVAVFSPTGFAEEIQAVLTGTEVQPDASGLASYRVSGGRGRGLEITVDGVDLTDSVYVLLNGDIIAQIALVGTRGGVGLETRRGDHVPEIQPGDVIEIADLAGTILLRGEF